MKLPFLTAISGLLWLACASAQAPAPTNGSAASPSAAASPHQRDVLGDKSAGAQESPTPAGDSDTSPAAASTPSQRSVTGGSAQDPRVFMRKAAQDGMTEVKLAALAMQKSQSGPVRKFAGDMQRDHAQANSELQSLASREKVTLSDQLDSGHQAEIAALSARSGADFDRAYSAHMVKAHEQAIALFKQAERSSDDNVAEFAHKTLPTLEHHQSMANELASETHVASAPDDKSER